MKKILSVLLAVAMVFSMSATAFAADFKDTVGIPQSGAIDVIETLGIVNGYGDGTYGPDNTITRAHLCTMLTRALYGDPIYVSTNQFKDVPATHWANAYINTAYAYGLMAGYGGGYFGPEDEITYTQMAAVIMKALGYDCSKISWPAGINSMGHTLGLFDNVKIVDYSIGCTRAHAAQMLYNAFDLSYVNHKADYPVSLKGTSFLKDGLGFEETVKIVDGHKYIAYIDLDDGEVYETDNCLTYEKVIYHTMGVNELCTYHNTNMKDHTATSSCTYTNKVDGYGYHFKNTNKSHNIDWYWMDGDLKNGVVLYVNGTLITSGSETLFADCDEAIGVFDEDDTLIAIYIESEGSDYVYSISSDAAIITSIVKSKDMPKNTEDMTVTYFIETGSYIISTKIDYGWVTGAYKSAIHIDGHKYMRDDFKGDAAKGDFVKMYYNYRNELVAIESYGSEPFWYDVTDKTYHTVECDHVIENISDCNIVTYDNLEPGSYTFKECNKCHANDGTIKITIKAPVTPVTYVTGDGWTFYHVDGCSKVTTATVPYDKNIHTTQIPCPDCITTNGN